ncbi:MAG: hypothetical protein CMM18_01910 [Rhodospirillaceae bacterium]|nr:hypothetical protein [Rhodospirillaceae bacterium]
MILKNKFKPPKWVSSDGKLLTCKDKITILNKNIFEIEELTQDSFDDAMIMGVDEIQFKKIMVDLVESLSSKYIDK